MNANRPTSWDFYQALHKAGWRVGCSPIIAGRYLRWKCFGHRKWQTIHSEGRTRRLAWAAAVREAKLGN